MGLTAYVYRSDLGDCSAGGISGKVNRVTVVNVEGPSEPSDEAPAVMLVPGNLRGTAKVVAAWVVSGNGDYAPAAPADMVGPMMGGTYVGTSDSRFCSAVEKLTGSRGGIAPLHDRYEVYREGWDR